MTSQRRISKMDDKEFDFEHTNETVEELSDNKGDDNNE